STSPQDPGFVGGTVAGILVEMGDDYKVVAQEPMADLQPLAKPDPNDLPNNHLAYAGQWFFFALTALVIYAFALKSRAGKRG
ncbi:MAG: SURF1 family cytochrome oxidase biogenesis protein, partial [Pseudomonadota bacterium]